MFVVVRSLYTACKLNTLHFWQRGNVFKGPRSGRQRKSEVCTIMPTFRKLDDWRHYIERVNHFFEANEITNPGKGRSIFLVSVGAKTYKLVRSLPALEDPKYKSYEDLAKHLQEHFMPEPSAIVQRFKFNTRSQQPGETIAMFLAELRHLTEHCEFGSTLEEMLRDRLVCGVRDIRIQRQLLAEPKLTLKRALDLALAIEAADKDASEKQKGDSQGADSSLNKVDAKVDRGAKLSAIVSTQSLPKKLLF